MEEKGRLANISRGFRLIENSESPAHFNPRDDYFNPPSAAFQLMFLKKAPM